MTRIKTFKTSFSLTETGIALLRRVSDETMIPQSRIVEQAVTEWAERRKASKS